MIVTRLTHFSCFLKENGLQESQCGL